jgi:APA family basic amino acid/polyamine antiporter
VFVIFIVYALVNFSLIWLRYNQPDLERPFKSPVAIRWFPILAGLGLATSLAMLTQFDIITMVAGAIAAVTALAGYASIGRYTTKNRQGRGRI